jgi:2'-5' RNA ligase
MHRVFFALKPPPEIVDACFAAMEDGPRGWAWQDEAQLHVTLRFIGEVDRHRADDIVAALLDFRGKAVDIGIDGVGWFDHGPRGALFARVTPKGPLETLHEKLDRLLVRLGQRPERRAFQPHITLARRRGGAEAPQEWLARMGSLKSAPVAVDALTLYESRLGRHGASYEPLLDVPLSA